MAAVRRRASGIKRILLDQTVVSGVGNIYADEALWRSRLHGERLGVKLRPVDVRRLLGHVREVMGAALLEGGTSFDALYVNVNGEIRVLRPVAARLRPGGPPVRAVRHARSSAARS